MNDKVYEIEVVDVHVSGDVHRVVLDGVKELPGDSVLAQMQYLEKEADGLRRILLEEPRGGHPSIFADLVVRSDSPDANAGFIIFELMGYPKISGTNTMSTALALMETGRVPMKDGYNALTLELPGGLLDIQAECKGNKVLSVSYEFAAPSFVYQSDIEVDVPGTGKITFDLTWTGAFYPVVDPSEIGLEMTPENELAIVEFARRFVLAARHVIYPIHPEFGDEGPLTFLIFAGKPKMLAPGNIERPVSCYEFPKPNLCRAPSGTGTTAGLIQMVHRGEAEVGHKFTSVSAFGTSLGGEVTSIAPYGDYTGVTARITGEGWIIAKSKLTVDFTDPMTPDDGLQEILIG